jgi:IS5 family transposase
MQLNLFGTEIQLEKLTKMGDVLIEIEKAIDFEIFRKPLETAIRKPNYEKGGRPAWDVVLMFKIVMLMSWYGLSYKQAEYQCNNRLDFMRFLRIEIGSKVPDENAIWDFKEALKEHNLDVALFKRFEALLKEIGYKLDSGSLVDASFVEVPKRHVVSKTELETPEKLLENESLSVSLEEFEDSILLFANDDKTRHILSQTDFDASWTKKNNQSYFGYKDHACVDKATKFITDYAVTPASVHDSQEIIDFINERTNGVWADSAYMSAEIIAKLREINPEISINICNRAYRNKPLTIEQKEENTIISKVRARVEHVFGFMTRSMSGMVINSIGIARAMRDIGLKNLGYNMQRLRTLKRQTV